MRMWRWIPIGLAALTALGASCSVDPVRDLQRQAVGMRPRLLESCLPEAGEVEIIGDVERLTYAWSLGDRIADSDADPLESDPIDSVGSFRSAPPAAGSGCQVILEIEEGLVRQMEIGVTDADEACARRVRSCLASLSTTAPH